MSTETVSETILFDRKKRDCVFQNVVQTRAQIVEHILADTEHGAFILSGEDREAKGILMYEEMGWQFSKRLASGFGLPAGSRQQLLLTVFLYGATGWSAERIGRDLIV